MGCACRYAGYWRERCERKSYSRGNVVLTAENVGAVATGGDTAENTATFTSSDVADGSASAWTSVSKLSSGENILLFCEGVTDVQECAVSL